MKTIELGKLSLEVAQHKGDISYERFVKFKQYAPQFWEKMDVPLFEIYYEGIQDLFNQGKYFQMVKKMEDYHLAIKQSKGDYDAWGVCFVLITDESSEVKGILSRDLNDSDIQKKLKKYNKEGLTADVISKEVVNFMKASPETFSDHLVLYAMMSSQDETVS